MNTLNTMYTQTPPLCHSATISTGDRLKEQKLNSIRLNRGHIARQREWDWVEVHHGREWEYRCGKHDGI